MDDDFTLVDDCNWLFYGPSSSSASAHDDSSIFHQVDTRSSTDDVSSILFQQAVDTHISSAEDVSSIFHPSVEDVSSIFHPSVEDVSSIFHQVDTHPSAPCLGFEEWMQVAADTYMEIPSSPICDGLIENNNLQLQLNGTLESALSGHDLPPPTTSPQVAAACINAARSYDITSGPQEAASSSTSITNANLFDLKSIIVKKPILDEAVENLGGGQKGAQRLWALIQVWLRHRNTSTGLKSPVLSNIAKSEAAAAQPTSLANRLQFHESNVHVENAALFNGIGPAMDALLTSAPIVIPGESVVLGTTATTTAVAACELPTRSRAKPSATAAELRAARKHRIACKRRYSTRHEARPASNSLRLGFSTLQATGACHDSYQPDAYSFSKK